MGAGSLKEVAVRLQPVFERYSRQILFSGMARKASANLLASSAVTWARRNRSSPLNCGECGEWGRAPRDRSVTLSSHQTCSEQRF